jgi:hypothetical protein
VTASWKASGNGSNAIEFRFNPKETNLYINAREVSFADTASGRDQHRAVGLTLDRPALEALHEMLGQVLGQSDPWWRANQA